MAATVTIGGALILVDDVGTDRDGRTIYGYSIRLDGLNPTHQGRDLKSGCQGGTERDGLASLLSFLTAAAEAYGYTMRTGRESDNGDLFPPKIMEWAYLNDSEISLAAYEMESGDAY